MKLAWALVISATTLTAAPVDERARREALQHFRNGQDALAHEQYAIAEREFKAAVKLDPLFDAAFYGLGQTYMALKRYREAVRAYIECRDAFHASAAELVTDAQAFERRLRDSIEVLKDAKRTLERQPPTRPGVTQQLDKLTDQIQELEGRKSRSMGSSAPPTPARVSLALGSAYFRAGVMADAEREYRAAIEVDPKFGEAHNNLAVVCMLSNRLDEAEREIALAEKAGFRVNPQFKADLERRRAGGS